MEHSDRAIAAYYLDILKIAIRKMKTRKQLKVVLQGRVTEGEQWRRKPLAFEPIRS